MDLDLLLREGGGYRDARAERRRVSQTPRGRAAQLGN